MTVVRPKSLPTPAGSVIRRRRGRMEISVSDPEKHGTSTVNAFVDFRIRTTTKLPQFAADDFFVRRRYRDFVWLRQQLTSGFPGAIVPPLPAADPTLLLGEDRFADAFIERRQARPWGGKKSGRI